MYTAHKTPRARKRSDLSTHCCEVFGFRGSTFWGNLATDCRLLQDGALPRAAVCLGGTPSVDHLSPKSSQAEARRGELLVPHSDSQPEASFPHL